VQLFRYRTNALIGPWRASAVEAAADAVRAGQAERDAQAGALRWKCKGCLEVAESSVVRDEVR
jgi:hypothetical protein